MTYAELLRRYLNRMERLGLAQTMKRLFPARSKQRKFLSEEARLLAWEIRELEKGIK